jgi:hypothetical protein
VITEISPLAYRAFDICIVCGDPYGQPALSQRCLRRHWQWQDRPCQKCGRAIDYRSPRKLEDGSVHPRSLTIARIVPPAEGKRRGWSTAEINALSNFAPRHAACPKIRN